LGSNYPIPIYIFHSKKKKKIPYPHQREAGLKVGGDKAYTGTGEV